ncbi:MAG: hypothetical protein EA341_07290 [Mongoliibacter sp.]|uniref:hypothetical protein n=1 Tax=Mongoliibacter sp. TaxID=2022438 RepID=UPI0012F35444|nr:hypothetical protein [Mongoliibacter sp.]TVP50560.1 MAG: hypothetical protein EA341_07290 [Mongoliibacter sp.]
MAKQTSIITLKGNIGKLNFYKTKDGYQVREKGGVSRSRIMNDPKYARTRENIAEFKTNAAAVKLVKDTIRPATVNISDSRIHQRLIRRLLEILRTDPVNRRGERMVSEGDWTLIEGMEINNQVSLGSVLKEEIQLQDSAAAWEVSINPFLPSDFLLIPDGATHFRIFVAGASFNFETGTKSFVQMSSVDLLLSQPTQALNLSVQKSSLNDPHKILLVGIDFQQIVNGEHYKFNNTAHNSAVILKSEKS